MKLFKNHKKNVEKVKKYAGKNKVFIVMMILAIMFLLGSFLLQSRTTKTVISDSEMIITVGEPGQQTAQPPPPSQSETWRFYFVDIIILGVGGGFCLVMILRQRRKTREELK